MKTITSGTRLILGRVGLLALTALASEAMLVGGLDAAVVTGLWRTMPPMPDVRCAAQARVVGGEIFLFGGMRRDFLWDTFALADDLADSILVYSPALDAWEERGGIPTKRGWPSVTDAVDGLVYVIGGYPVRSTPQTDRVVLTVEAYDPATDRWMERAPLPAPRGAATVVLATAVADGIVFVLRSSADAIVPATLDAYDPKGDSWTVKTSMPTASNGINACVVSDSIYVIEHDGDVFVYDLNTDSWHRRTSVPVRRTYGDGFCVADGLIYAFVLGEGLLSYDPTTDQWAKRATPPASLYFVEMMAPSGRLICLLDAFGVVTYDPQESSFGELRAMTGYRYGFACALVAGRLHVFGGATTEGYGIVENLTAFHDVLILDSSPPVIARQPLTQTLSATGALTLSIAADTDRAACTYRWRKDGVDIVGATNATFTLPCAQGFHAGDYSVVVTNEFGSTTSVAATITVNAPPASDSRLLNVSTRAVCRTGDQVLIPGFVIAGTANKRLLLRAVGPTLGLHPFDLTGVLPNPRLALKRWNGAGYDDISANNNWRDNANVAAIAAATAQVSAFPLIADRDAALLVDLAPGQYTVFADCADGGSGVAIVELYDADDSATSDARLINLSNRGFAGVGDEVMIPGFVVSDEGPKTLLVRVVGPTLAGAPHSVAGAMADPMLALHRHEDNGTNTLLFTQDNWSDPATDGNAAHTAAIAAQVRAFPLASGSKDAAFVVTLPPGVYTVVGSSADGVGTGIVLVEVYVVE